MNDIREFQDEVRELVIKLSGAPDSMIDGKGSDAGWQEFTLAEIAQGFAFMKDEIDRVQKQAAEMRVLLEAGLWSAMNDPRCREGLPAETAEKGIQRIRHALSDDAGRDYINRESVKPLMEALERIANDCGFGHDDLCEKAEKALEHARALGL